MCTIRMWYGKQFSYFSSLTEHFNENCRIFAILQKPAIKRQVHLCKFMLYTRVIDFRGFVRVHNYNSNANLNQKSHQKCLNSSSKSFKNAKRTGRGHSDLNQGPIGLQPIALPLSYTPALVKLAFSLRSVSQRTLQLDTCVTQMFNLWIYIHFVSMNCYAKVWNQNI